jgi:DNA-binding PadR family transcriptional regulator
MAEKKTNGDSEEGKVLLDGRSPLRTAVLAVLLEKPGHGYDVAHRINMRLGASWRLEAKHIYPVLEGLERAGLLRSERDPTDRRKRRIFYPTESAEQARRKWLTTPTRVTVVREDIQTRLAFSSEEEAPDLLRALAGYRNDLLAAVEENSVSDVLARSWLSRVMGFTRSGVDHRLMAELEWIGEVERELEEFLGERR